MNWLRERQSPKFAYGSVFARTFNPIYGTQSARPKHTVCLHAYRRLEARALPEAVGHLREIRRGPGTGALISLSGADPLNLAGILTPGPKLPALTGNRILYRDGLPLALFAGGDVQYLEALDDRARWEVHKALLRGPAPARLAELA